MTFNRKVRLLREVTFHGTSVAAVARTMDISRQRASALLKEARNEPRVLAVIAYYKRQREKYPVCDSF